MTQPPADGLIPGEPRALLLGGVQVDEIQVHELALLVPQHAEQRETLHRVLEQPRVPLLGRLQVPKVPQAEDEQQSRGDGHEADPLDRRQDQLDVLPQAERPEDPVGQHNPRGRGDGVDERVLDRQAPCGAASLSAGVGPVCRHCSEHHGRVFGNFRGGPHEPSCYTLPGNPGWNRARDAVAGGAVCEPDENRLPANH